MSEQHLYETNKMDRVTILTLLSPSVCRHRSLTCNKNKHIKKDVVKKQNFTDKKIQGKSLSLQDSLCVLWLAQRGENDKGGKSHFLKKALRVML